MASDQRRSFTLCDSLCFAPVAASREHCLTPGRGLFGLQAIISVGEGEFDGESQIFLSERGIKRWNEVWTDDGAGPSTWRKIMAGLKTTSQHQQDSVWRALAVLICR